MKSRDGVIYREDVFYTLPAELEESRDMALDCYLGGCMCEVQENTRHSSAYAIAPAQTCGLTCHQIFISS